MTKPKKTKKTKNPKKIEWPAAWSADEGWPTRDSGVVPNDPAGRTWADYDDYLRSQGKSLAQAVAELKGEAQS